MREISQGLDRAEDRQVEETLNQVRSEVGPPPLFNRSAIRRHALKISVENRSGKFKRVSQEFIDNICGCIESQLRKMDWQVQDPIGQVDPDVEFLTGEGKRKLAKQFNLWIAREIHRQTKNVRVGQTF